MPHLKSDHLSQLAIHLVCHTIGQGDSRQSSGLGDCDFPKLLVVLFQEELAYLRALAGACLPADESHEMVVDSLDDFLLLHIDGKLLPELFDVRLTLYDEVTSRYRDVLVCDVLKRVGFVFVLAQHHWLLLLDDLEGLLAEGLDDEISAHHLVGLVDQPVSIVLGFFDEGGIDDCFYAGVVSINSEDVDFGREGSFFLLFGLLIFVLGFAEVLLGFLFFFDFLLEKTDVYVGLVAGGLLCARLLFHAGKFLHDVCHFVLVGVLLLVIETVLLLLFLLAHPELYYTVNTLLKITMQKFQEILAEAAQLKETQLKNERKNYESLPDYLKAGLNYSKKYQLVRQQPYMIQMHLSDKLKRQGNTLFKKELFKEALSRYEEALAIFRYISTKSYDNMKDEDLEYHFFQPAAEQAKFSEEYETHLVALYLNICSCLTKLNKKEDAVHSAQEALKIKETAKAYYKKAQAYLQYINRQTSDIKVGFYFLNKCYELSNDASVIQEMQRIKREIDEERDKEKKWFKFMFDKNSKSKEQTGRDQQDSKLPETSKPEKASQELRAELARGEQQQKEGEKLEKTKQKLSKFTNLDLSQQQWREGYEGEFIAKHGSKIYSLIQLLGYKEYLGQYRAMLAQCLQLKKQAEGTVKRRQAYGKYFQWLRSHPVDQIGKYLERYQLQTQWIKQRRAGKCEAEPQERVSPQANVQPQQKGQKNPTMPMEAQKLAKERKTDQTVHTKRVTETNSEISSNLNIKFIQEVHQILQKQPHQQAQAKGTSQTIDAKEDPSQGVIANQTKSRIGLIKYASLAVAVLLILLLKFAN